MTQAQQKLLADFRADSEKVKTLREVLNSEIMVEANRILDETGGSHSGLINPVSPEYNCVHYGAIIGYTMRGDRLKDLATHIKEKPIIEADYKEGN